MKRGGCIKKNIKMVRYMYVSCKNVQLRERISRETWNHQGSWREAIYHATRDKTFAVYKLGNRETDVFRGS